jgi:hypothetical protein
MEALNPRAGCASLLLHRWMSLSRAPVRDPLSLRERQSSRKAHEDNAARVAGPGRNCVSGLRSQSRPLFQLFNSSSPRQSGVVSRKFPPLLLRQGTAGSAHLGHSLLFVRLMAYSAHVAWSRSRRETPPPKMSGVRTPASRPNIDPRRHPCPNNHAFNDDAETRKSCSWVALCFSCCGSVAF